MSRRVELPGADELFRAAPDKRRPDSKQTGRVKHDEKITIYISRDELLALEGARLQLRGDHDLPADRGRIVRAAIARALEDFDQLGEESDLVVRLRNS